MKEPGSGITPANVANAEEIRAARTAAELRKPMPGGGAGNGRGGGSAGCVETSVANASISGSSRCGLPHLWQNRASSGSLAPHVQNSFTNDKFRMGMLDCLCPVTNSL